MKQPEQVHISREFTTYGNVDDRVIPKQVDSWVRTFERSEYTDPLQCLTGCFPAFESFRYRKVKAPVAFTWLFFQTLCVLYQEVFLAEMDRHIGMYEGTAAINCGPEHMQHGVCLGPHWKLAYSNLLHFPGASDDSDNFDFRVRPDESFPFSTQSSPATCLVVVEPQEPHSHAHYHFAIAPKGTHEERTSSLWQTYGNWGSRRSGAGKTVMVFEQRDEISLTWDGTARKEEWEGRITLDSPFNGPVDMHIYVVDSLITHLKEIHSQPMCSFENSWIQFSKMSHRDVMSKTRFFTRLFQLIQIGAVALIFYRYFYQVEGSRLFTRVLFFKLLLQDFPQQICMVMYLYAWYGQDGMRCQLCLFHPEHCIDQYPLHTSNLIACILTLTSAASAQMFMQVTYKAAMDEDDIICFACGRLLILSISILPFSTAVLLLSQSVLHLGSGLVFISFAFLAICGWSAICFTPMLLLCDDI